MRVDRPQTSQCAGTASQLIAPRTDLIALKQRFASVGRVQIPDVLDPSFAETLHQRLADWKRWGLVTRIGGQHRNFDSAEMEKLDAERLRAFHQLVAADTRSGFQYLYDRHPVYDVGFDNPFVDPILIQARELLQSEAFLDLARSITGMRSIAFADGQMTRYRRGQFLTLHDDLAEGKHRLAAYVLGLTPDWATDYGGQLQFLNRHGDVEDVFIPGFNVLSVFKVPSLHQVTTVAAHVSHSRLSITGWLRAGSQSPG